MDVIVIFCENSDVINVINCLMVVIEFDFEGKVINVN